MGAAPIPSSLASEGGLAKTSVISESNSTVASAGANNATKASAVASKKKEVQTAASKKDKAQAAASNPKKSQGVQKDNKAAPKKTTRRASGKNQQLGALGEEMACRYLEGNNFNILERNWRCKSGEADIIASEEGTLVFIEVKTRSEGSPGLPECAVTAQKRARYERIALSYLMKNQRSSGRVRFDVIAIQMTGNQQCLLRHHRDAFGAGE